MNIIFWVVNLFHLIFWGNVIYAIKTNSASDTGVLGIVVLIIGIVLIIFHKGIGESMYKSGAVMEGKFKGSFLNSFGVDRTNKLYLSFGIVIALSGIIIYFI